MRPRDLRIECPDWCNTDLAEHEPIATEGEGFYIPHGCVSFGPLAFGEARQWPELDTTTYVVHVSSQLTTGDEFTDPAELRQAAADLRRAAEWLEAQSAD
jgi:hypothetical protein